jgi:serine/threonine-protein kinase
VSEDAERAVEVGAGREMSELLADRYELLERIGAGGMAEVFRARMVGPAGFRKVVALKRILEDLCSDQDFLHRFIDEARLTARLQHPNICQVLDFGAIENRWFITMEYIDGIDLSKVLARLDQRGELLQPDLCLAITSGVLRGLGHAHQATDDQGRRLGIVHRDVSPQNVLLSVNGDVKLSDFGVAKADALVRKARTMENVALGKLAYMAPEQRIAGKVDERTDIFGAGILLAEMLQGPSSTRRCTSGAVADRERLVGSAIVRLPRDLAPRVGAVIERATDPRPERRYADAISMLGEVEQCASELGVAGFADRLGNLVRALRDEKKDRSGSQEPPPRGRAGARTDEATTGGLGVAPTVQVGDRTDELATRVRRPERAGSPTSALAGRDVSAEPTSFEDLQTQVHRGAPLDNIRTRVHQGATAPFDARGLAAGSGAVSGPPGGVSDPPASGPSSHGSSDLLGPRVDGFVGPAPRSQHVTGRAAGASDLLEPGVRTSPRPAREVTGSVMPPERLFPQDGPAVGAVRSPSTEAQVVTDRDPAWPLDTSVEATTGPETPAPPETTAVVRGRGQRPRHTRMLAKLAGVTAVMFVTCLAVGIGWHLGWRGGATSAPALARLIGVSPEESADAGDAWPDAGGAPPDRPDETALDAEPVQPRSVPDDGGGRTAIEPQRPPPSESPPAEREPRHREEAPLVSSEPPEHQREVPPPPVPRGPGGSRGAASISIYADPPGVPYVDGRLVGPRTPVREVEVPPGRHEVRVHFPSTRSEARRVVTVRPGVNEVVWLRDQR